MASTSINIQPCKVGSSEEHNRRLKHLDYVRTELSHKNESWQSDKLTLSQHLDAVRTLVKEKTGRKLQDKATPLREGVIVIQEKTSLDDLQRFAKAVEEKWGIKALQIHTHKDEGHYKGDEWKANLHAHIVFLWVNQTTGKSIKLDRSDMVQMQTLLAETLGMERGVSSDKQHLSSLQFKVEQESKKLEEIQEAVKTSVEASIKPIEDIFEAHRGVFGVKVKEVIRELSEREGEKAKGEVIEKEKVKGEIDALKRDIKREKEARIDAEKKHASIKEELVEFATLVKSALGERFKAFCEDCDRYKRNFFRDIHKFQMWLGGSLKDNRGNEFSADREAGKLLINGKTQDQLIEVQQERSRGFRR